MRKPLTAREIARRRIVERFECTNGKGEITLAGRLFRLQFDDALDFAQALEVIAIRLTGKVLHPKFRPTIKSREALKFTAIIGGDYDAYQGAEKAPISNYTWCEVTDHLVKTHYLRIEIQGNVWESWFGRLDELLKCVYIVVREAQGDPYVPAVQVPAVRGQRATSTQVAGVGHA